MDDEQSNAVTEPDPDLVSRQLKLESWGSEVGGQRATRPGFERGAENVIVNRLAADYLKQLEAIYEKSKRSPGKQAHVWNNLPDIKALRHNGLEAFCWAMSAFSVDRPFNQAATIVGARAELVNFLLHPQWGRSMHLQGLRLVNGRGLDMSLMIKRLTDRGFNKARQYKRLSRAERAGLGALFLEVIAQATQMIEIYVTTRHGKKIKMIRYTENYWKFVGEYKNVLLTCRQVSLPMLVPPRPWKGHNKGGWLSSITPVSTVPWERWPELTKCMHPCVLESLNIQMAVPYELDWKTIDLCQTFWQLGHEVGSLPSRARVPKPDDKEFKDQGKGPAEVWAAQWRYALDRRKDGARSQFINGLVSLQKLEDVKTVHFVAGMDHRTRVYMKAAQINPQGPDHFRSMLQFKEASPVKDYIPEFAWSLGDALGLDKNMKLRMDYLNDYSEMFARVGNTPLDMLPHIVGTKKPHYLMQLCRDWAGFMEDPGYKSGTIHWRDQTCSGWGHVACLTGCQTLAQYSNIIGRVPADLYSAVGQLVMARVKWRAAHENHPQQRCLQWWAQMVVPRSVWKDALMPVIYGRSYQSLTDTIASFLRDEIEDFLTAEGLRVLELARVLATQINDVIKEALPHVRDLSQWLSKVAVIQMEHGLRPYYFTPNGVAVETYATETKMERMDLNLAGKTVRIHIRDKGTKLNRRKTCSKLVPDFIHGHDAAFLQRFVSHWSMYKHPITTTHDCFGTTLENVDTMQAELNDQWARFYSIDYLMRHWRMVSEVCKCDVPLPPMQDTLNRDLLGTNPYLFC